MLIIMYFHYFSLRNYYFPNLYAPGNVLCPVYNSSLELEQNTCYDYKQFLQCIATYVTKLYQIQSSSAILSRGSCVKTAAPQTISIICNHMPKKLSIFLQYSFPAILSLCYEFINAEIFFSHVSVCISLL